MKNLLRLAPFTSPGLRLTAMALAVFAAVPLARAAFSAAAQGPSVWTVHVGDPQNTNRDGEVTIEIDYEYIDSQGTKKHGTKKVTVPVPAGTTGPQKKGLIEKAINDTAPKVPADTGTPVYEAQPGLQNTVQVAPKPDTAACNNAKVKDIEIKDKITNERDKVQKPPTSAFAVTRLSLEGPIATHDGLGNGSILSFESNHFGVVDFSLKANSDKYTLLAEIEQLLADLGALTLLLENGPELLALLPEDVLVGIGTDDDTMATVLGVSLLE